MSSDLMDEEFGACWRILEGSVARALSQQGYELVDFSKKGRGKLYLAIDHSGEALPESRIQVEDCVRVSEALNDLLDQLPEIHKIFPKAYELEVSSPGPRRPLKTIEACRRFQGYRVRGRLGQAYPELTQSPIGSFEGFLREVRTPPEWHCNEIELETLSESGKNVKKGVPIRRNPGIRGWVPWEKVFDLRLEPELAFKRKK